ATSSPTAKGNQGKGAELLLDGSRQLLLYYKAADKSDVWFEIRFSRSVTIDKIIIKPRGKGVPVDYQVKAPLENGDWRTIIDSRRRYPHLSDIRDVNTLELADVTEAQRKLIVENTAELRALTSRYDNLLRGPQLYVGKLHSPRTTYLMRGGDPQKQGPVVSPGFLEVLSDMEPASPNEDFGRRLALANAIGSKSNPLTARVISNRIWQHYFGTGIVDTPSDFGLNGGSPTHPELLDWLATYLMDHDWSLKQLHRVILNSATFRQVSHSRSEAFGRDSESRLLWRFPPQRLEAEVLRDSILRASGKLNTVAYGEPFKFFEEATSQFANRVTLQTFTPEGWRRMIYGEKLRLVQVGVFGVFDCPDASQMTPRRSTSTSAAQALSLFNSNFVNNQAAFMASEIENSFPNDPGKQLESAFLRVLSRPPTKQESDILLPLVSRNGLEPLGRILFNLNEFIFLN
ncbi:MAG: DUF1553 domain-containing protein, partial [Planctomycetota bacterium]|nr:DUF1553 domain-containing protein [Planctomycetota bacterium]